MWWWFKPTRFSSHCFFVTAFLRARVRCVCLISTKDSNRKQKKEVRLSYFSLFSLLFPLPPGKTQGTSTPTKATLCSLTLTLVSGLSSGARLSRSLSSLSLLSLSLSLSLFLSLLLLLSIFSIPRASQKRERERERGEERMELIFLLLLLLRVVFSTLNALSLGRREKMNREGAANAN